jgi:tRNA (adenine57-N1/adenine58-N1)-methyltransferase
MRALVLVRDDGRLFLAPPSTGLTRVDGLGLLDFGKLMESVGRVIPLGTREYLVRRATLDDIPHLIERKAQIVREKDAARIISLCNVGCDSTVLEAGAGSGAMSIAFLMHLTSGKLVTYEVREDFAAIARRNVERFGLADRWELRVEDVRNARGEYDAVFLDLPEPWEVMEAVQRVLRPGGALCVYLPTFNQLERAREAMEAHGFRDIKALEVIEREMVVRTGATRPTNEHMGHTAYIMRGFKALR